MTFSLYDAVIPSNIQILRSIDRLLDKAALFCVEHDRSETDLVDARLAPDMLPFGYQVKACTSHSVGAIAGVRAGSFTPDRSAWPTDIAGLHAVVQGAIDTLDAVGRTDVDAMVEAETAFTFGETTMPFSGANFLLSFSQPNFYFHATTAYAILRAQGMKIGKRDYLGTPRMTP